MSNQTHSGVGHAAKAAVVRGKSAPFAIEQVQIGPPTANEVLVRVLAVGICHTDAIVRDQYYPFPLPGILGHEGSGIVEDVGANVTNVACGDHVVMTFMSCGQSRHCHPAETTYYNPFFLLTIR